LEFREELKNFIEKKVEKKPLIFFIDELDRCRPNYAVEVLEQVKHFFNVPGIVFVLSIDKEQMVNAIKGFYGNESINGHEYLRRFIDLEYVIPAPETATFCNYLYNYYGFNDFLYSEERRHEKEFQYDKQNLIKFAVLLFEKSNATLRQQEKVLAHARVVLSLFQENNYIFPTLYILLIYTKTFHAALYEKIRNRQFNTQDLLKQMKIVYPDKIAEDSLGLFTYTEALLAIFYNNYYSEKNHTSHRLFDYNNETKKNQLTIKPVIDIETHFLSTLEVISRQNYETVQLSFLLNKIDLLETLST
jgi:hypothetical protein